MTDAAPSLPFHKRPLCTPCRTRMIVRVLADGFAQWQCPLCAARRPIDQAKWSRWKASFALPIPVRHEPQADPHVGRRKILSMLPKGASYADDT